MRRPFLAAILLCLSACDAEKEPTHNANPPSPKLDNASSAAPSTPQHEAKAPQSDPIPDTTFSEFSGIKVGVSIAHLRKQGKVVGDIDYENYNEGDGTDTSCGYASLNAYPGVHIMFNHDRVVRIDVENKDYPAIRGIRIGDTQASAIQRLGNAVKIEPHPYGDEADHYLIMHNPNTQFGMIIETWEGKVESYRIGYWEEVQLIEGCS